ncbi:MAG TPA: ATP-binding protein [Kofleriaceae bacterium]|nr:ATP-binding protein [Kofleriaceae bacterium]
MDPASHLRAYLDRLAWLFDDHDSLDPLLELDAAIAEREASALPLCRLRAHAGLDVAAIHVLVAAAAPLLDAALGARMFERIRGGAPTIDELVALLAFSDTDEAVIRGAADALVAHGLVEVSRAGTLDVDARMVAFLRGDDVIDGQLRGIATLHRGPPAIVATDAIGVLGHVLGTPGPIIVDGPTGVGKTTIAIAAITTQRRAIEIDIEIVAAAPDPFATFQLARREALLHGADLVIRARTWNETWPAVFRNDVVAAVQDRVAIVCARDAGPWTRVLRGPRQVRIAMPSPAVQVAVWQGELGDHAFESVVARYPLPIGDIAAAAAAVRATCALDTRTPSIDDIAAAARARVCHRLGEVAGVVDTTLAWEDVVLRPEVETRVREIIGAFRFRDRVMEQWGFADKLPYGRALSALFSGAPGTGKTMVATLIGKELGLEVFRVDLSKVVSKYIGETERNLDRVFAEASRCRAMLLFDEADSLFAKRTEVKSSNDRYANLEVNFLLQRLEAHDGVVILTTNAATAIDPAFARRLRYRVEFPTPDHAERALLWRAMIPRSAPMAGDVDFAALGKHYKLSGGHIKNAVVRAAYLAASSGALALDHDTLVRAARLEWAELGNLPDLAPSTPVAPLPIVAGIDRQLIDVLARTPGPSETIEMCFARKEHELGTLFAALPVVEARALHRRLVRDPAPGDELAVLFSRLKVERRRRLVDFLADARRRAVITKRAS